MNGKLDPIRAEALRAAVAICTPGNSADIRRRLDSTLVCADMFVWFLLDVHPTTEAAADAIDAEKAA